MKSFLFITDFDGTMTAQDFYLQIIYRYQHEKAFSKEKKRGVELLFNVFKDIKFGEEKFLEEIKNIPLDPNFFSFFNFAKKNNIDILILSAGAKYYIEKRLFFEGIENVEILANDIIFENGGFRFLRNKDERFFSPIFGIDKEKVVSHYKNKYKKIFYAGDSYVDFKASILADFIFAKKNLVSILKMLKIEFFEFENFDDIIKKMKNLFNF